jgi:thioesterase-3
MRSAVEIKVRGYHTDFLGHVNHGRYVELMEEARWGFFEDHPDVSKRLAKRGVTHAVVKLEINYRKSAGIGDLLRVETWVKDVGNSSVVVAHEITVIGDEDHAVSAEVTNVFLDGKTGKPAPIREEMLPLRVAAEERKV